MGTSGGGAFRLHQGVTVRHTRRDGPGSDIVVALYEDRAGRLWMGTGGGGLSCGEDGRLRSFTTADGLSGNDVRAMVEDYEGNLWIGTNGNGLTRSRDGRFTPLRASEALERGRVWSLHVDPENTLWIGTAGGGLFRYRGGHLAQAGTQNGLPDDLIYCILEDARGRLWLSGTRGIACVEKTALERHWAMPRGKLPVQVFDESDGLPSRECTGGVQPAGWRGRDGRLWFSTVRGLAVLDPERLGNSPPPPPVELAGLRVNGRPVLPAVPAHLGPGVQELTLQYAALSPGAADKARFRHRLVGRQADWVEAGRSNEVTYANLPPGR